MATGKGVLPGDTGGAVGDEQPQILGAAQAHGVGQEQELLGPALGAGEALGTDPTVLRADAGYYSDRKRPSVYASEINSCTGVCPTTGDQPSHRPTTIKWFQPSGNAACRKARKPPGRRSIRSRARMPASPFSSAAMSPA